MITNEIMGNYYILLDMMTPDRLILILCSYDKSNALHIIHSTYKQDRNFIQY